MGRMMKDLAVDRANNPSAFENDTWDEEEEDNEDDGDEANIIDRGMFATCVESVPDELQVLNDGLVNIWMSHVPEKI